MKNLLLILLIVTNSFSLDFPIIEVTENEPFNYFFSFPIYTMFVILPFLAVMSIFKKI
ncbi:hypothetical protein KO488_08325 [Poseidonibacter lekithochrous]|uniref:hypothetical protein n=1 Tax=Poseidonibacter TaxID=2321187 RepID=UPI001C0A2EF3|nr:MULTISPECIES: hypothetical protein [Poseidonibacter]MBU3014760.1 hypothetical protein [Poseidonibacter lekithochrous]MDO6828058.1 hypothetical protein [Poseidonibacter sp. 1_MG-2023]